MLEIFTKYETEILRDYMIESDFKENITLRIKSLTWFGNLWYGANTKDKMLLLKKYIAEIRELNDMIDAYNQEHRGNKQIRLTFNNAGIIEGCTLVEEDIDG